jgi:hypothetical protein
VWLQLDSNKKIAKTKSQIFPSLTADSRKGEYVYSPPLYIIKGERVIYFPFQPKKKFSTGGTIMPPLTTSQISLYLDYTHFLNTPDIDGKKITPTRLIAWVQSPNPPFICIFCGSPVHNRDGFMSCPICYDYKGIMPDCPS